MTKPMDTDPAPPPIVIATGDHWRAIMMMAWPPFALIILGYKVVSSGHALWEYPLLIAAGDVAAGPQIAGWLAAAAWYWILWVPALQTLARGHCLVAVDGDRLLLPDGSSLLLTDIVEAWQYNHLVRANVVIRSKGDRLTSFSWIFLHGGDAAALVRLIMEHADAAKAAVDTPG